MFKLSLTIALLASISAVLAAPTMDASFATRAGAPFFQNIHPALDQNKCVGIVGGVPNNGTQADIYDCNQSKGQEWQLFPGGTGSQPNAKTFVTRGSIDNYCLDAGNVNELANGVKVKVWKCFDGLPQQQWIPLPSGQIALGTGGFCLDLTDGKTDNQNVLQIWECAGPENKNQIWNLVFEDE